MFIRPAQAADLDRLADIDGTIESAQYLHVNRSGEGLTVGWVLEERPLREKLVDSNAVDDERSFAFRQVVQGIDDGVALVAEHDQQLAGLAIALPDVDRDVLRVIDLRVDYDYRRQGIGSGLMFSIIAMARAAKRRAIAARSLTNNLPAARFLQKAGFDLAGLDTHFHSNHDLVKEAASLFWYAALD